MAQFGVHVAPGRRRGEVSFVVTPQSDRYRSVPTRLVAALSTPAAIRVDAHWLAPMFVIDGREAVLNVFNFATVPPDRLGPPVASLADDASRARLMRALDEFVTQA